MKLGLIAGIVMSATDYASASGVAADWTVFPVIDTTDPSITQGSAAVVDADKGIFLTAKHIIIQNPQNFRVLIDSKQFSFEVVASGDNLDNPVDDWAVLKIRDDRWSEMSVPGSRLAYDPAYLVGEARIVTTRNYSSVPNYTIQSGPKTVIESCGKDSVLLVEVGGYDKGDSGSPMIIQTTTGRKVVATTSGWLPSDQNKSIAKYFLKLKDGGTKEILPGLNEDAMRDIVKNIMLLKLIPVKCIMDGIILNFESLGNVVGPPTDNAKRIISIINSTGAVPFDGAYLRGLNTAIEKARNAQLSWLDFLFIWEAFFFQRNAVGSLPGFDLIMNLLSSTEGGELMIPMSMKFAKPGPSDAGTKWAHWRRLRSLQSQPDQSQVLTDFFTKNADVGFIQIGPSIKFNRTNEPILPFSAEDKIKTGSTLVDFLKDPTLVQSTSKESLSVFADLAATFLSQGVEQSSNANIDKATVEYGIYNLKVLSYSDVLPKIGVSEAKIVDSFRSKLEFKDETIYSNSNIFLTINPSKYKSEYWDHVSKGIAEQFSPNTAIYPDGSSFNLKGPMYKSGDTGVYENDFWNYFDSKDAAPLWSNGNIDSEKLDFKMNTPGYNSKLYSDEKDFWRSFDSKNATPLRLNGNITTKKPTINRNKPFSSDIAPPLNIEKQLKPAFHNRF